MFAAAVDARGLSFLGFIFYFQLSLGFPKNSFLNCFAALGCIHCCYIGALLMWYSHLFQNFPQFIVIHTVKGFAIVNKAEVDIFLDSLTFLMIKQMLAV